MSRTTHGMTHTRTYKIWDRMIQRCKSPRVINYERYGGRGIKVCARWNKFANFFADMGVAPDDKTIERIDNNGNYEPTNCRWATWPEQYRNRRNTVFLRLNGITKSLTEWSDETRLKQSTIYTRLRRGWTTKQALTEPLLSGRTPRRVKA